MVKPKFEIEEIVRTRTGVCVAIYQRDLSKRAGWFYWVESQSGSLVGWYSESMLVRESQSG